MADEEKTEEIPEPAVAGTLEDVAIEEEMSRDYIDYSMSVIVGRALPYVPDGLKPVHRRCLYSMYMLDNTWNKKHLKSARIVGDLILREQDLTRPSPYEDGTCTTTWRIDQHYPDPRNAGKYPGAEWMSG